MVSLIRFSATLALYSTAQLEQSLNLIAGDTDVSGTMHTMEKTLNSLSEVLIAGVNEQRKGALDSLVSASGEVLDRTLENAQMVVPSELFKVSTDILQATSDVTAKWVVKAADV